MLTRLVRIQLVVFTVFSVVAVTVMMFNYMRLPTLLGVGRLTVTLELPAGGGLYRFSNVTYRGVQMGTVTSMALTDGGAKATLSLSSSPKIPVDLRADVRSVSPIGEQYVDLQPLSKGGPFLTDGAVIPLQQTAIPQQVGPMLDQVSALVQSIPKDEIGRLVDEGFNGLNGAGNEFRTLLDALATVTHDINGVSRQTQRLVDDAGPLLDSQAETADAIRAWGRGLADVTTVVAENEPDLRAILERGPGFAAEVSALLDQVKPTLPLLLGNLSTVGQILVTYNPGVEQLLVLVPGVVAAQQSFGLLKNNPYGIPLSDFTFTVGDPPACTVGFLPPSEWRDPDETSVIDTPDDLYCKLPQDSPISVRGARNFPCMAHPGKRAPTVELCDDPRGFQPLAMRQHSLGPYPFDPNLVAQGIPPDDRLTNEHISAPVEGTPVAPVLPPKRGAPEDEPPVPSEPFDPATTEPSVPHGRHLPEGHPPPAAAPSGIASQRGGEASGASVAIAGYDPRTGRYTTPDGKLQQLTNVGEPSGPRSWKDLLPF
ncbi:Uncharacterised protein [Mycolicibacterium vanbaalenii]|uniref:Uncharacterized protein n=1 Tax=Mycolicibacterium vanbaalenii TaxID=110539 RepID=A0A5S9QZC1_MYCVN|nr:MlaD family protein [Mycolicibacterium vanbaalenii]CAA0124479.1 Uncharacterised protein [Mycolicibacterium vanbaalenii]